MSAPDQEAAHEAYRREADRYDRLMRLAPVLGRWRSEAVHRLELAAGDTVIDVGCGTGASFDLIEKRIGPEGRLIAIDLSPDMLAQAVLRVAEHGWNNVTIIEGPVDEARPDRPADAALFVLTHDIMRSPRAIANVVAHLRPGAAVAVLGAKLAPGWAIPVNLVVRRTVARYATTLEGLERPWSHLEEHVPDLRVTSIGLGGAYIASGRLPA